MTWKVPWKRRCAAARRAQAVADERMIALINAIQKDPKIPLDLLARSTTFSALQRRSEPSSTFRLISTYQLKCKQKSHHLFKWKSTDRRNLISDREPWPNFWTSRKKPSRTGSGDTMISPACNCRDRFGFAQPTLKNGWISSRSRPKRATRRRRLPNWGGGNQHP